MIIEFMLLLCGDYDSYDDICDGLMVIFIKLGYDNCCKEFILVV